MSRAVLLSFYSYFSGYALSTSSARHKSTKWSWVSFLVRRASSTSEDSVGLIEKFFGNYRFVFALVYFSGVAKMLSAYCLSSEKVTV